MIGQTPTSTESDPGHESTSESGDRASQAGTSPERPAEIGGRDGPEPTRFGDWEKNGRCIDF